MQNSNLVDKQRMAAMYAFQQQQQASSGVPSFPSMPASTPRPRIPVASVDWPNSSPVSPPGRAPMLASQHKMTPRAVPSNPFTLTDASNGSTKALAKPPSANSTPAIPPGETILVENETRRKELAQYQKRDDIYQKILNKQHKQYVELAREKKVDIDTFQQDKVLRMQHNVAAVFGKGYMHSQSNDLRGRIVYPRDRKRRRQTTDFNPLVKLAEQASKQDTLVPIRLDLEIDGYKLRDTFTWNLNESLITPEQFAIVLCEDLNLPVAVFKPSIVRAISEQIEDYELHVASMVTSNDQAEDEAATQRALKVFDGAKEKVKEEPTGRADRKIVGSSELRTLIKIDIIVGNQALIDQFEWDISCRHNSPEKFAEVLVNDLGLGGEFKTAIAHSIREQVHAYVKYLLLTGHEFDGSLVTDEDLKRNLLPTVKSIMRDLNSADSFTPAILELTNAEIDKFERDRMREARRKRRQVRSRRGLILPDLEPIKTHRTNSHTLPPTYDDMSDDNGRGSTPEVTTTYYSTRRSAQKARQNIAAGLNALDDDRASSHMQNAISLNAGNRFSTMADHATKPVPSHMVDRSWLCSNCQCTVQQTSIVRTGPYGEKTLCNACGLYFFKFNKHRPPNYTDSEIRNQPASQNW
ncbi:hypothetical protein BJV82DRAFT_254702 [Fennellomyces sp. T-0311]|nr:hypothetical protein BJV82DRAFT_254702 [Fennellomyces sp. T-0311]